MTRALWAKELREHGWPFAGLALLDAVGFAAIQSRDLSLEGAFEGLRHFLLVFTPLNVMFLCNRLVVNEYAHRTQLFLEGLPITRFAVVTRKLALGLLIAVALASAAQAAAFVLGRGRETLDARLAAVMFSRVFCFTAAAYVFAFFAGLLGQLRAFAWVALGLFILGVNSLTQSRFEHFPVIALVRPNFAASQVAASELLLALGSAVFFALASLALALGREGLTATYLARRMSSRAKVVAAGVALLGIAFIAHLEARRPKPAFTLDQGEEATRKGAYAAVGVDAIENSGEARTLAGELAGQLARTREELDLPALPPAFVVPSAALDTGIFERASYIASDGVVVRAGEPDLDHPDRLEAEVVRQALNWSARQGLPEDLEWLRDGYVGLRRADPEGDRLRAAWALQRGEVPTDARLLRDWETTQERLGSCMADAVAAVALGELRRELGEERVKALLSEVLGRNPPADVRAWYAWEPADALLRRHGAPSLARLAEAVARPTPSAAAALASIPRHRVEFVVEPASPGSHQRLINWKMEGPLTPYRVLYGLLAPYAATFDRHNLDRVDGVVSTEGQLPFTFGSGRIAYVTVELEEPALDCMVRAGTLREELP